MGFTCGIVGLPNVGKSTLFNAITSADAAVANYPFCTIDPNVGIVPVPDRRLDRLTEIYKPAKTVPTTLEFLDIAGLVRGASKGEGLGNQFLSHIGSVDSIAHVVRCFDDTNVIHVDGSVNPKRDIEIVETELILKDIETIDRKRTEAEKRAKSGDKHARDEVAFYPRVRDHLSAGRLARYFSTTHDDENLWLRDLHLLTNKPVMYICNVHERHSSTESDYVAQVRAVAAKESAKVVLISAEVEAEIADLPEAERAPFLQELGMKESGLNQLIREGYDLLRLITFFTVNPKELHAWTIPNGTHAAAAAGVIHTDFEKGFIRAEILKYSDLDRTGSEHALKEAGLLHVHGRDYAVEDGDVMFVRFNL
ncbi:MAG: redox-regulated ATPase YchF [Ignavibacteriales bacterium]|nr:redox-regulated ATPase YchF [Ignavibacteriales bacterium]